MTTHFVTRHPGARDWARRRRLNVDCWTVHLEPDDVQPGDTVIGTLPVHLIWEVNRRGGRYLHLILDLLPELRGRELSADDLERCGARLEEYRVATAPAPPSPDRVGKDNGQEPTMAAGKRAGGRGTDDSNEERVP